LTPDEQVAIRRLAEDIPTLWTAPTTTAADRQAIARLMLERVVITVAGTSEKVAVVCHWAGGVQTHHSLRRPVARVSQLSTHAALRQRIAELHAAGTRPQAIAAALNAEGWKPAKRRETFTAAMVRNLLHQQGVPVAAQSSWTARLTHREPAELTIGEVAARLAMPANTVHRWVQRGVVTARKVKIMSQSLWLIHADDAELAHLRGRRNQSPVNQNGS